MACILCMPLGTFAQRVTHTYNNVSLSEALLQLNNEQTEYVVNFLYNELEDFRITTTVSRKSLPDAILFGNKAASISVTRRGAQMSMPHLDEVEL